MGEADRSSLVVSTAGEWPIINEMRRYKTGAEAGQRPALRMPFPLPLPTAAALAVATGQPFPFVATQASRDQHGQLCCRSARLAQARDPDSRTNSPDLSDEPHRAGCCCFFHLGERSPKDQDVRALRRLIRNDFRRRRARDSDVRTYYTNIRRGCHEDGSPAFSVDPCSLQATHPQS